MKKILQVVILDRDDGGYYVDVADVKKGRLEMVFKVSGGHAAAVNLAYTVYNTADNIRAISDCSLKGIGQAAKVKDKIRSDRRKVNLFGIQTERKRV